MQEWIGKVLVGAVLFVQSLVGITPPPEALPSTVEIRHRATTTPASVSPVPVKNQELGDATVRTPSKTQPATPVITGKPTCTLLLNGSPTGRDPRTLPTVKTGDSVTLSWSTSGATEAEWYTEGTSEPTMLQGTKVISISVNENEGTWSQALFVENKFGLGSCNVTARLIKGLNANYSAGQRTTGADLSVPPPTCLLKSDKMSAKSGDTITISWESTNAEYATDPSETDRKPTQGSRVYTNVTYSRSYALTFFGKGGRASCVILVPVDGFVKSGAG